MSKRQQIDTAVRAWVKAAFGPEAHVAHINYGDAHRRMLLWNRRFDRAHRRSLRNQPPRTDKRTLEGKS